MAAGAPTRSFKAFAVVEALRNGSEDVRGAILPFFHPPLAFANGQVFDAAALSRSMNEAYSWNITSDIVEGFIPAFLENGWLTQLEQNDHAAMYRVTCHLPDGTFHSRLNDDLRSIAEEFERFVRNLSPLSTAQRSSDDLLNILIRWISSLDVFSESELHREVRKTSSSAGKATYEVIPTDSGISQDEQYLCARFADDMISKKSGLVSTLLDITRIGLITEAVQDFAKPISAVKQSSISVYLDAPVAMDLLGVSGRAAQENIRPIVNRLIDIGASVRIFDDSVEEIRQNLSALFRRAAPLRTGLTANAIRKGQALEAYVREVAARPDRALAQAGVQIVSRRLDQYPNDHKYFTEDDYRNIYSKINWHIEDRPRNHDATVVTNIVRMRRGVSTSDLFESGHILVTRNGILPGAARRYMLECGRLSPYSIGPVIHQRQLATAVWLRAGLSSLKDDDVPLRYLLASCERVLQLRPDVVDKVRQQAKLKDEKTADQLDLLLTVDRSTQILMDRTLNVSSVVTEENIEELLDSMKATLIEEHKTTSALEIKKIKEVAASDYESLKREAEARLSEEAKSKLEIEVKAQKKDEVLQGLIVEDQIALDALIIAVNNKLDKRIRNRRKSISGSIFFPFIPLTQVG